MSCETPRSRTRVDIEIGREREDMGARLGAGRALIAEPVA